MFGVRSVEDNRGKKLGEHGYGQVSRPNYMESQRCSAKACVPCDKGMHFASDPPLRSNEDGCFVAARFQGTRYYKENKATYMKNRMFTTEKSDLTISELSMTLHCVCFVVVNIIYTC